MTDTDVDLKIRFYGRFLFFLRSGELTALAVNMQFNSEVPAGHHDAFLLVPEAFVKTDDSDGGDTPSATASPSPEPFVPTHRVITSMGQQETSQSIWDLAGYVVETSESSGFRWKSSDTLADVGRLANEGLNPAFYETAPPKSPVTALIRIAAGEGSMRTASAGTGTYDFIYFSDDPEAPKRRAGGSLADGVEVRLPGVDELQLTFTKADSPKKYVKIKRDSSTAVTVAFSNLSGESGMSKQDKEFAGFYEVLAVRPRLETRFVPRLDPPDPPIQFLRPMGNCYVAAKLTLPALD